MWKLCRNITVYFFQSHLLGVFDNVNEVEFHVSAYDKIMAVISQEGEKVEVCYREYIKCVVWLQFLDVCMWT